MGGVPEFAVRVTENGHGPVVLLAGELDLAASGQFRECLHGLVGQHVTLDFSDVTFMDSSAIGVLVAARLHSSTTTALRCATSSSPRPAPSSKSVHDDAAGRPDPRRFALSDTGDGSSYSPTRSRDGGY